MTDVTLPDGTVIAAELAVTPDEQQTGLMFRESLPDKGGMLFIFLDDGPRPFWMYQTLIPLDLIWMDRTKRVVEIVPQAPPCKRSLGQECPNYGGAVDSRYVLELAGGKAAEHGVRVGAQLNF